MNGIRDLVRDIFVESGIPASSIVTEPFLPGYYRARKKWDMAVTYKGALVAALEFKSQVGSVGKNANNRFEEALGSATDLFTAQWENEAFGKIPPWLGYVFVLREDTESEKPGRSTKALFPADNAFHGMSYSQRYQEMLNRFIGKRIYGGGWFITTRINESGRVTYNEPLPTATGIAFRSAVEGRVDWVKAVLDADPPNDHPLVRTADDD